MHKPGCINVNTPKLIVEDSLGLSLSDLIFAIFCHFLSTNIFGLDLELNSGLDQVLVKPFLWRCASL